MREITQRLERLSAELGDALVRRGWLMTSAESCTGGLVATVVTDVPGSSQWFDCGFVTYSNASKMRLLGVSPETLDKFGAVSEQTVVEMARGALAQSRADVSVAISGIAGPSGATPDKPVGTVWLAWASRESHARAQCHHFPGDREEVRARAAVTALLGLLELTALTANA